MRPAAIGVLDLREVSAPRTSPLVSLFFGSLAPGASFILVSDQNIEPFYHQLDVEQEGRLLWEDLEEGPGRWIAQIVKPLD
ncbi:MAG: DUF2249 domain-containing protein [Bdellovibrionota bacterium]